MAYTILDAPDPIRELEAEIQETKEQIKQLIKENKTDTSEFQYYVKEVEQLREKEKILLLKQGLVFLVLMFWFWF
jgi:predicted nuclease with TOPRIM domain